MKNEITSVSFHGDELLAVRDGDRVWVVLKRACEALGMQDHPQAEKLKEKPWAVTRLIRATGTDGKSYEMLCLDLESLPMWLATVDTNRVKPEAREKLVRYQVECAKVLRDHFFSRRVHQSPLLADAYRDWSKTWSNSLMTELCKLKGEVFAGRHPRWCAWINGVIYECLLGKETYAELRATSKANGGARFGRNHHQMLTAEAKEKFDKHLVFIEGLASISSSPDDLVKKLRSIYQGAPFQLPLAGRA